MPDNSTTQTHIYKLRIHDMVAPKTSSDSKTTDNPLATAVVITGSGKTSVTYDGYTLSIGLGAVRISRKVYQPGHIDAEIQVEKTSGSDLKIDTLKDLLLKKKVDLLLAVSGALSDYQLAKDYYIHHISPVFAKTAEKTSLYICLSIYSMDKLMTLNKFSQPYLGQMLGTDIMKSKASEFHLKYNDIEKKEKDYTIAANIGTLQNTGEISNDVQSEYIQPYLVQYNESFYDFLKRTANRCGEFLFYENGQLNLGITSTETKSIQNYTNLTFQRLSDNPLTVEDYSRNSTQTLSNQEPDTSEKGNVNVAEITGEDGKPEFPADAFTKAGSYTYNAEVAYDDYYMLLYKNQFSKANWYDNLGSAGTNVVSVISKILNSQTLFDAIKTLGFDYLEASVKGALATDKANDSGNKHISAVDKNATKAVPFADAKENTWLKVASYNKIREANETQQRQMICVDLGSEFMNIKVGDKIKVPEDTATYIVIQVEMQSDVAWKSNYDGYDVDGPRKGEGQRMMKIYAVPQASDKKFYPPMIDAPLFRTSGTQTAFVVDNADPKGQGRVRIKYSWQADITEMEKEETKYHFLLRQACTPWIRMTTSMATTGGGVFFRPEIGDEVLVDFESGNVERPYVVGLLYSKNMVAPKDPRVIVSPNGHTFKMDDPTDGTKFLAGLWPGLKFLQGFKLWSDDWKLDGMNGLLGGISMADKYGFYKLNMSSHDRKIEISCPLGNVKIDAFTGISITAPNGDIKIQGKNVDITAANNLTITSGTNVRPVNGAGNWLKGGFKAKNVAKGLAGEVANRTIGKVLDFSLLRTILEVFLRPIDGTMELRSFRYLRLEAGGGWAEVDGGKYNTIGTNLRTKKGVDNLAILSNLVTLINARIDEFVDKFEVQVMPVRQDWDSIKIKFDGVNAPLKKESDASVTNFLQSILGIAIPGADAEPALPAIPWSDGLLVEELNNEQQNTKTEITNHVTAMAKKVVALKKFVSSENRTNLFAHKTASKKWDDWEKNFKTLGENVWEGISKNGLEERASRKFYDVLRKEANAFTNDDFVTLYNINYTTVKNEMKRAAIFYMVKMDIEQIKKFSLKTKYQLNDANLKKVIKNDGELTAAPDVQVKGVLDALGDNDAAQAPNNVTSWGQFLSGLEIYFPVSVLDDLKAGAMEAFKGATADQLKYEHDVWRPEAQGEILFANSKEETINFSKSGTALEKSDNMYATEANKKNVVKRVVKLLKKFG